MFFDWITPTMSMLMRNKKTFVISVADAPVLRNVRGLHNENITGSKFVFDARNKDVQRICQILDRYGVEYWYN